MGALEVERVRGLTVEQQNDLVAAEARLSEYEQALQEIAEWDGFTTDCCDCMEDVVAVARAALSGSVGDAPLKAEADT